MLQNSLAILKACEWQLRSRYCVISLLLDLPAAGRPNLEAAVFEVFKLKPVNQYRAAVEIWLYHDLVARQIAPSRLSLEAATSG